MDSKVCSSDSPLQSTSDSEFLKEPPQIGVFWASSETSFPPLVDWSEGAFPTVSFGALRWFAVVWNPCGSGEYVCVAVVYSLSAESGKIILFFPDSKGVEPPQTTAVVLSVSLKPLVDWVCLLILCTICGGSFLLLFSGSSSGLFFVVTLHIRFFVWESSWLSI